MDDSFAFHGTRDPRRLDPRALKFGIAAFVFVLVTGLLVQWAVASERTSFHRLEAARASAARQVTLQGRQLAAAQMTPETAAVSAAAPPSAAALPAQTSLIGAGRRPLALSARGPATPARAPTR